MPVRYSFPKLCRFSQYVGVWDFSILFVSLLLFACCLQTFSVDSVASVHAGKSAESICVVRSPIGRILLQPVIA
jgi:hypothetical protein